MDKLTLDVGSDELAKTLKRANVENPKPADMKALAKVFDERPDIWRAVGDLNAIAQRGVIAALKATALTHEAIKRTADDLRAGLGYEQSTPIERMLIDQVVLTWLEYHWAQTVQTAKLREGTTFANGDFMERRVNGAQRRHLRAVSTLARVRQMGTAGPMQINVAKNQRVYNVGAPIPAEDSSE